MLDLLPDGFRADPPPRFSPEDRRVPIAFLGDSDSQGYQDSVWYGPANGLRGGEYHAGSFSWTEILSALRSDQLDAGERAVYGGRRSLVRGLEWLGFERRSPRKHDHRYNFAFGTARCADLNTGVWRQVPRLLAEMAYAPDRWQRGVVVIRIGIVDLGGLLPRMATGRDDAALMRIVDECVAHVATAVQAIRQSHRDTAIVLVGIQSGADFPPAWEQWVDPQRLANVAWYLDRYDAGLQRLATGAERIRFFDDRAFFANHIGRRGPDGRLHDPALRIGDRFRIEHTLGDAPTHVLMEDEHYGTAYGAVWAQAISHALAELVPITPLRDEELILFLQRSCRW